MADVLLVEDDPHQRAFAALVLSEAGHAVREASDGAMALRLAQERCPELVVCDVVMPGMNGYQFVAALRADPAICTTPVILLTSLSERAQVRTGMNAGADDYLPKPLDPRELLESANAQLRRRRTQYDAIAGSVMQDMDAALAHQREQLASRYEQQLLREVNSRWKHDVEPGSALEVENATVLVAGLFTLLAREAAGRPDAADLLRRAHQAASDALYLFGAVHVLHHGDDIVGVFGADTQGRPSLLNPVRATFALQTAVAGLLGLGAGAQVPAGLALGRMALVRLHDPLHGDGGMAPVPGAALQRAQALRTVAQAQGWPLAVDAGTAALVPEACAQAGRQAPTPDGPAAELVRARQAETV